MRPSMNVSSQLPLSEAVGRKFFVNNVAVDPLQASLFAEVVGQHGHFGPDATHPCFVINPAMHALTALLDDKVLDLSRSGMLHASADFWFFEPVVPGTTVNISAVIADTGEFGTKKAYRILSEVRSATGDLLVAIDNVLAFPKADNDSSAPQFPMIDPAPIIRRPAIFVVDIPIEASLPTRYAQASGDFNPIHIDPKAARDAGLDDVIVHGMCGFSLAASAVIDTVGAGNFKSLRRIRVRFARPLYTGTTLRISLFETEVPTTFALIATTDDQQLWRSAICEVAVEQ